MNKPLRTEEEADLEWPETGGCLDSTIGETTMETGPGKIPEYLVAAKENSWVLLVGSGSIVESQHVRRADALARGRELIASGGGGRIFIRDLDGRLMTEQELLSELWIANVCPYCETQFIDESRVGSGRIEEGGFCSLTCYAAYYRSDILRKAGLFQVH